MSTGSYLAYWRKASGDMGPNCCQCGGQMRGVISVHLTLKASGEMGCNCPGKPVFKPAPAHGLLLRICGLLFF